MPMQAGGRAQEAWLAAMPALFVVLWSTGFIAAKLGLPDAAPATFLVVRFLIVTGLMALIVLATGAPWPRSPGEIGRLAVIGVLVHGVYLGGVFAAIDQGVEAGTSALIVGVQPLLVAAAARPMLGERLAPRQWLGLVLGLAGVVLVVWNKLGLGAGTPLGYAFNLAALFGMTAGTLYQKKHGARADVRSGNVVQFAAAGLFLLPFALAFEPLGIAWSLRFVAALAWLCLVLSLGAVTLLYVLIRRGSAARVSSLFYLVPPCTAIMAYPLFGEALAPVALAGMAAATLGVALVNWTR